MPVSPRALPVSGAWSLTRVGGQLGPLEQRNENLLGLAYLEGERAHGEQATEEKHAHWHPGDGVLCGGASQNDGDADDAYDAQPTCYEHGHEGMQSEGHRDTAPAPVWRNAADDLGKKGVPIGNGPVDAKLWGRDA